MKPKASKKGDTQKSFKYDQCQTPPYAIEPLLPYLPAGAKIWEPAAGDGWMVRAFEAQGCEVAPGDLLTGQNFFESPIPKGCKYNITNPPYSVKYKWAARCYQLGLPFALLIPLEALGAASLQRLIVLYGAEIILLDKRVDFKMPNTGWAQSSAQFPVFWFTSGLNIGQPMTFAKLHKYSRQTLAEMDAGVFQLPLLTGVKLP